MMNAVNNVSERETELVYSIRFFQKSKGSNCPDVVRLLNELGSLYEMRCEYYEAERAYRRSIRLMSKIDNGERNIEKLRIRTICNLGRILRVQGRHDKAEQEFFKALIIANKTFGPAHLEFARVLMHLEQLYESMGFLEEAKALCRKAYSILGALN